MQEYSLLRQHAMQAVLSGQRHGASRAPRPRGKGFRAFDDSAMGVPAMQVEYRVRRMVMPACDVQQSNGLAPILANDLALFTFSIHGIRSFPFRRKPAISMSNWWTARAMPIV